MLVLINGLPYFSKKIAKDLNNFDKGNKYLFLNTYESRIDQIKFILLLPFCKAVISFNGVSDTSSSLNWVLRLKKKLIMQWHGTDVQLAVKRYNDKSIEMKYIKYASHLASAPWFVNELKEIVPNIKYAPFGYIESYGNSTKYDKISVLTYLAKDKEEFYGWNEIKRLAIDCPEIQITVVGIAKPLIELDNVKFLGWVNEDELLSLMNSHAIFIRLTDSDGKAITVSQALSKGCEIIWTKPFSNCHLFHKNKDDIIEKVNNVKKMIELRGSNPNQDNIKYSKNNLLKESVFLDYTKHLTNLLNE